MIFRRVTLYAEPLMPILIGVCLGITLVLVFAPFSDDDETCALENILRRKSLDELVEEKSRASRKTNAIVDDKFDYGHDDIYEPRIKKIDFSKLPKNPVERNIIRPRYASTELGVKEKLFIGVLTSRDSIDTLGVAVNKTLTHYVQKVVFFMDNRGPTLPEGMSVVSFTDEKPNLKPFHMLKYIGDHYLNAYDWYMFLPDTTYARGEVILEMVSQMSINNELHMGKPIGDDPNRCDLSAGILLSRNALAAIVDNLAWCIKSASSNNAGDNVGKCFYHATGLPCMSQLQLVNYTTYSIEKFDFDLAQESVRWKTEFNNALTVHTVTSDISMYKMHRYFCELEMNVTREELEQAKEEMVQMSPLSPGGVDSLTWPIGVDPPSRPKSRFDVTNWDYFTSTYIYLHDEFTNMRPLIGIDKADIDEVVAVSVKRLNEKYDNIFTLRRLMNGYRHFDPTRGMDYKLTLGLTEKGRADETIKQVNLLRPLGYVEMVPMPYVTENTRVNLVLPVTVGFRDGVVSFLDWYARTCLDSGDNANLFVVFIYEQMKYSNRKDDDFSVLKSMISYYESKYMNGARIAWTSIQSSAPTQFTVMDAISKKFPPESLLLLCTVGMQLNIDFLNRVRMNSINGWQVYFPIGFWGYKPNLVYNEKPYPSTVEISHSTGHFDDGIYDHASFYNADYMAARKEMVKSEQGLRAADLYDLFLKHHTLHVFRAVEPALVIHFTPHVCTPSADESAYSRCLTSKATGLASRSQLAMLIFEHQQKVDQGQMKVMQQKVDDVDQIKPNILHRKI